MNRSSVQHSSIGNWARAIISAKINYFSPEIDIIEIKFNAYSPLVYRRLVFIIVIIIYCFWVNRCLNCESQSLKFRYIKCLKSIRYCISEENVYQLISLCPQLLRKRHIEQGTSVAFSCADENALTEMGIVRRLHNLLFFCNSFYWLYYHFGTL